MGNCRQLGPIGYCRSSDGRIYIKPEIPLEIDLSVGLSVSAGKTFGAEKLGNDPSQRLARGLEVWRKMSEDAWKPEAQAGEPTVIGTINLEKRF